MQKQVFAGLALGLSLLVTAPTLAGVHRSHVLATQVASFTIAEAISGDGNRIVFASATDPLGTNADGNTELFLWDRVTGLVQLSDSQSANQIQHEGLDIDFDGDTIVAAVSGDILSQGATQREIYRWTETGGFERLTTTPGGAGRVQERVSISDSGKRVVFTSSADLTGLNPLAIKQAFLWEEGAELRQVTVGAPCSNAEGSTALDLSGHGRRVLFLSVCQFGKINPQVELNLLLWDEDQGVQALTNDPNGILGPTEGRLNVDGSVAAVNSRSDLAGTGAQDLQLYRWTAKSGIVRLSPLPTDNGAPAISADGRRIAYLAKNGQGGDVNPKGNTEIFLWRAFGRYQTDEPIVALTDSPETAADLVRALSLSAAGDRLAMRSALAIDPPTDNRRGLFLVDIVTTLPPRRNLLANSDFDTGLGRWKLTGSVEFSPDDAVGNPASGSVRQVNAAPVGQQWVVSLSQCLAIQPNARYVATAMLRGQSTSRQGGTHLEVSQFGRAGCTGDPLVLPTTLASSQRTDGSWIAGYGRFRVLPGVTHVKLGLSVSKAEAGGSFAGGLDAVSLRRDPEPPLERSRVDGPRR